MKDCFNLFPIAPTLDVIKEECSAAGFDRLVPTHTPAGQAFIESKYSDISLFWNAVKSGWSNSNGSLLDYATTSWNPNLDCLVWTWKTPRQQESDPSNITLDAVNNLPSFYESAKRRWYNRKTKFRKQKRDKRRKGPRKKKELSEREKATQDKTTAQAIWWIQLCCGQIEEARSIPAKCKGGSSGKESKKQNGNFNGICHEEEAGGSRVPLTFYQRYFF